MNTSQHVGMKDVVAMIAAAGSAVAFIATASVQSVALLIFGLALAGIAVLFRLSAVNKQ